MVRSSSCANIASSWSTGIACWSLGANSVMLTDLEILQDLLSFNVKINTVGEQHGTLSSAVVDWTRISDAKSLVAGITFKRIAILRRLIFSQLNLNIFFKKKSLLAWMFIFYFLDILDELFRDICLLLIPATLDISIDVAVPGMGSLNFEGDF